MTVAGHNLSVTAATGFVILFVNLAILLFAAQLAPHSQTEIIGGVWAPPSPQLLLGTDYLGRDMLSRLLYGGQLTIFLSLLITLLSFALGLTLGLTSAAAPPVIDTILARIVDTMMSIPTLIFGLVILSVLGTSFTVLIVTIAVLESTKVYRVCRAIGMEIAALEYVSIARMRGERLPWIMWREILPNMVLPLLAEFGLRFCYAMLFISALSFLGLGVKPPSADWGNMVKENAAAINISGMAPLFPAAAIALLTIGINLIVDWLLSVTGIEFGEKP